MAHAVPPIKASELFPFNPSNSFYEERRDQNIGKYELFKMYFSRFALSVPVIILGARFLNTIDVNPRLVVGISSLPMVSSIILAAGVAVIGRVYLNNIISQLKNGPPRNDSNSLSMDTAKHFIGRVGEVEKIRLLDETSKKPLVEAKKMLEDCLSFQGNMLYLPPAERKKVKEILSGFEALEKELSDVSESKGTLLDRQKEIIKLWGQFIDAVKNLKKGDDSRIDPWCEILCVLSRSIGEVLEKIPNDSNEAKVYLDEKIRGQLKEFQDQLEKRKLVTTVILKLAEDKSIDGENKELKLTPKKVEEWKTIVKGFLNKDNKLLEKPLSELCYRFLQDLK